MRSKRRNWRLRNWRKINCLHIAVFALFFQGLYLGLTNHNSELWYILASAYLVIGGVTVLSQTGKRVKSRLVPIAGWAFLAGGNILYAGFFLIPVSVIFALGCCRSIWLLWRGRDDGI